MREIRGSVVSLSCFWPRPPEDKKRKEKETAVPRRGGGRRACLLTIDISELRVGRGKEKGKKYEYNRGDERKSKNNQDVVAAERGIDAILPTTATPAVALAALG